MNGRRISVEICVEHHNAREWYQAVAHVYRVATGEAKVISVHIMGWRRKAEMDVVALLSGVILLQQGTPWERKS